MQRKVFQRLWQSLRIVDVAGIDLLDCLDHTRESGGAERLIAPLHMHKLSKFIRM